MNISLLFLAALLSFSTDFAGATNGGTAASQNRAPEKYNNERG